MSGACPGAGTGTRTGAFVARGARGRGVGFGQAASGHERHQKKGSSRIIGDGSPSPSRLLFCGVRCGAKSRRVAPSVPRLRRPA